MPILRLFYQRRKSSREIIPEPEAGMCEYTFLECSNPKSFFVSRHVGFTNIKYLQAYDKCMNFRLSFSTLTLFQNSENKCTDFSRINQVSVSRTLNEEAQIILLDVKTNHRYLVACTAVGERTAWQSNQHPQGRWADSSLVVEILKWKQCSIGFMKQAFCFLSEEQDWQGHEIKQRISKLNGFL